jgi:hypothetical protein
MLEPLVDGIEHSACECCQLPVNDQGFGGAWVHTTTGLYTCPPGIGAADPRYALPGPDTDAIEAAVDKAVADTEQTLRDEMFTGEELEERVDDATAAGRRAMRHEIFTALDGALDAIEQTPGGLDNVRSVLTVAWNSVVP